MHRIIIKYGIRKSRQQENLARSLPFIQGKTVIFKLFTKTRPEEDQGNSLLPAVGERYYYA